MGERVSAVPSRLLELAAVAGVVRDELAASAAALGSALDEVRARCPDLLGALPDADRDVRRAAVGTVELGGWAHAVGEAFAIAGAGGDVAHDGLVRSDVALVEAALGRGWRPEGKVVRGDMAEWWRAVNAERCSRAAFYAGGGGFITGPDGRRYPLVAPTVVLGGRAYNAEWGREGASSVLDLLGADPGWRTVDVQSGIERHRAAPAWWERILIGIGSTVHGAPGGSGRSDVEAVILRPGRLPALERVPAPTAVPERVPTDGRPDAPQPLAYNAASLLPSAADFAVGALTADAGAHDAYQITFQENADGRRRALYKRVDVIPGDRSNPTELVASYVTGPDLNSNRVHIRHLGPDSAVISSAKPDYVVVDPAPGQVPGDHG